MLFNPSLSKTLFFVTEPQTCSYLPDRESVMLFADPRHPIDEETFARLIDNGFRRSGDNVYRPYCLGCNACVPVRLAVQEFQPNRSQRRCWKKNQDLSVKPLSGPFTDEHKALYQRYQASRHSSELDGAQTTEQLEYLTTQSLQTHTVEFRAGKELLAVATIDSLPPGWSAVYTFFEPDCTDRGLGTFSILWQIEQLREQNLDWLYLGYWIENCANMVYKSAFKPLEGLQQGKWQRLP